MRIKRMSVKRGLGVKGVGGGGRKKEGGSKKGRGGWVTLPPPPILPLAGFYRSYKKFLRSV